MPSPAPGTLRRAGSWDVRLAVKGFAARDDTHYIIVMPDPAPAAPRLAPCPICGKMSLQQFRPFCSKRCADVDLNRWLKGVYAVPVTETDDEDGDKVRDEPGES